MFTKMKTMVLGFSLGFAVLSASAEAQVVQVENNYNLLQASKAVKEGQLGNASKYLRRAVRDSLPEEQLVAALADLCGIDYALGKLESADKACSRAVRIDRKSWQAFFNRGYVRLAQGRLEEAETDYRRAVKLNPGEVRIQKLLSAISHKDRTILAENR